MSEYFPGPKYSGGKVKVELDLSNYATKADLKNATRVDRSILALKLNLKNLKAKIAIIDVDKLKTMINNADLDKKVATLATKDELKAEQDNNVNYLLGKNFFSNDGSHNIIVYQPTKLKLKPDNFNDYITEGAFNSKLVILHEGFFALHKIFQKMNRNTI